MQQPTCKKRLARDLLAAVTTATLVAFLAPAVGAGATTGGARRQVVGKDPATDWGQNGRLQGAGAVGKSPCSGLDTTLNQWSPTKPFDPSSKNLQLAPSFAKRGVLPWGSPSRTNCYRAAAQEKDNFKVLGHVKISRASAADLFFYDHGGRVGKHVYVGSKTPCAAGVKIIRVSPPGRARVIATATLDAPFISYEDVAVVRIGNRDVLGVGIQSACHESGKKGLALFDVTRPHRPRLLSFLKVPARAGRRSGAGPHELDMVVRRDGKALALLAVPQSGKDVTIVDISRPQKPRIIATWNIFKDALVPRPMGRDPEPVLSEREPIEGALDGFAYDPVVLAHSVRSADEGKTAYVSYWDAGELKLDISKPKNPKLVGRTVYAFDDEGSAHSLAVYEAGGKRYILQNDEDYTPLSPAYVQVSADPITRYAALEVPFPTSLTTQGPVAGIVHDGKDGCDKSDYSQAQDRVVVVDLNVENHFSKGAKCKLRKQLIHAASSGARALLVNVTGSDSVPAGLFLLSIPKDLLSDRALRKKVKGLPVVMVSERDGLAPATRQLTDLGLPTTMVLSPQTPSWGFLRVFEESTQDQDQDGVYEFKQVGSFSDLENVQGENALRVQGMWTIHNTEVVKNRAYSSWYLHGIVALDMSDPTNPEKVGQLVPSRTGKEQGFSAFGMWGVALDPKAGIVYGSDMNSGLWILKPTGPAAAPSVNSSSQGILPS